MSHYPGAASYSDKLAMLAAYAPTVLESYEIEAPRERTMKRIGLRLSIIVALIVGVLPPHWLGSNHDARIVWAGELCFFLIGVTILRRQARRHRRPTTDAVVRRGRFMVGGTIRRHSRRRPTEAAADTDRGVDDDSAGCIGAGSQHLSRRGDLMRVLRPVAVGAMSVSPRRYLRCPCLEILLALGH